MKAQRGTGSKYSFAISSTSALDWGQLLTLRPGRFFLAGKETRYPLYRRLWGPQSQSGRVRKISPPLGFDPQTAQPAEKCYTGYAVRLGFCTLSII
jgi:hypothetical protein